MLGKLDGAKLEVAARYSNVDSMCLLLFNFRVLGSRSTIDLSLLVGYEYEENIDTDHAENKKFIHGDCEA